MNEKRVPLEKEEPKHKKKSKAKGKSRSNHKHIYEPVMLYTPWTHFITKEILFQQRITNVCTICGRVEYAVKDDSFYNIKVIEKGNYRATEKEFNEKALALPKWYQHSFYDDYAFKGEE